jgi:uncharacterized protein
MTTHDSAYPPGTPCWMDLTVPDPAAAQAFYSRLFGWELEDTGADFGHYLLARKDGHRVGGVGAPMPGQEAPPAWTTYLATEDADATAAAISAAGGTVFFAPMDVGEQGRMFTAMDPAGASFGVWQAGLNTGSELANEPGSFTWNECMSRDYAAARTFYTQVFGFGLDDMSGDGFTYGALTIAGRPVGGLGEIPADMPADMPSHWMGYFKVEDADDSAATVVALGGSVQREGWDTPFGRMVVVSDSQGAPFSLMADTEASRANAAAQAD